MNSKRKHILPLSFSKNSKKIFSTLLVLAMVLSFIPTVFAETEGLETKLTIIHVNDRHGRTTTEPYISQIAKDIKASGGNVLILDAGDSLHGQTATNLSKGESMIGIMNAVGYDAMVPGNHDFNFGIERLLEASEMMDFSFLAANVKTADGTNLFKSYEIFPMNDMTVGVFGLITPETLTKVDPRIVEGIIFESPVETAANMVELLKNEGCDIIVALTHLGIDEATIPDNRSEALADIDGIDVIIDGHSHTELENGETVGNTLIAQTGALGNNIGIVEITIVNGETNKTARLIEMPNGDETELIADEEIVAKIKQEEEKVEPITAVVVGHTPFKLEGDRSFVRVGETNLADVITDSMIYATGADIAVCNGGGIRESIDEGDITMGQVLTTLPFSNIVVTIELSGADILKMLEHGVSQYPNPAGLFIQISGVNFTFDPDAELGSRVITALMEDGSPIYPDKKYTLATIEYLAAGGDDYDMLANGENLVYYGSDADTLANYLMTNPLIEEESKGRVSADSIVTREMFITGIHALAGFPKYNSSEIRFTDVEEQDAIIWAAENEIVFGVSKNLFAPDRAINREQMFTILYRYCKWSGIDVLVDENIDILIYKDALDISEYAFSAIQWAYSVGLIENTESGYLYPQNNVTKTEIENILKNLKIIETVKLAA